MEGVISSKTTFFSESTSKFTMRAADEHGWFSPRQKPIRGANSGKAKESCTLRRIIIARSKQYGKLFLA
jgi:hypothetical protein